MLCNLETIDGGDYPNHWRRLRRGIHNGRTVEWSIHRSRWGAFPDVICLASFLAVKSLMFNERYLQIEDLEAVRARHAAMFAPRQRKKRKAAQ